jgi:quinoprotein glucose dehydrogenase
MRFQVSRYALVGVLFFGAFVSLLAAEADVNQITSTGATDDPMTAMRRFRVAPGLKVDLFAAEPMIHNVVSFAFDEHGRCYVVESFRRRTSVFDIRGLGEWLDNDFSFRTVDDRAKFFKSTLTSANSNLPAFLQKKRNLLSDFNKDGVIDWHDLEVESERIQLLVDTNSDGRADVATTFAEGFDGITSGVAAGVLARKGDVWFTCIPDLWKISSDELRGTNGMPNFIAPANPHIQNSKFETRNLLHGFGVHIAFGGHDMHGLKMGPDGKMYFSIADRGTGTNLWDKIIDHWPGLTMEALADSGAVFRCQPDGTELEVVAIGLRNPQELVFDEFGNLFTGDNNGDGGDKARWEYIVEGADYGWRMGWQHLPRMGAWNSEMLWGLAGTNTSSYYLPPVAHIGAGPSGVAYYPGTGLPARYDRHFFMCDFRGGPNSVVRAFALRPKGASFEAFDETEFLTGPLCTDVDFGVDGAVYVSDWVKGWDKTDKGRIYRVFDPNAINDPAVLEVKKLLSEGFEKRPNEELSRLLGHRDMRVRLEVQWELVARVNPSTIKREMEEQDKLRSKLGFDGPMPIGSPQVQKIWKALPLTPFRVLNASIEQTNDTLRQLHAVWAVAQVGAKSWKGPLLLRSIKSSQDLQKQMPDESLMPIVLLGRATWAANPTVVRAAAFHALARSPKFSSGASAITNAEDHVRLSVASSIGIQSRDHWIELPAQRKQEIIQRLIELLRTSADHDPYLRHAAVFALARIGDVPALLAAAKDESPAVRLGVCLALRRLQRAEVAQFLNDSDPQIVLEAARAIHDVPISEAMNALAQKLPPSAWRGEFYDPKTTPPLLRRAMNARFRLGGNENAMALASFAAEETAPEALRAEALELLALWPKPPGRDHVVGLWRPLPPRDGRVASAALEPVLAKLEASASATVKVAAKKAAATLSSAREEVATTSMSQEDLANLAKALESGTLVEKQSAFDKLAISGDAGAVKLLSSWLDQLIAGKVPRELQLDVLEAARNNPCLAASAGTKDALAKFETTRDSKDALAKWRECLYGGNAEEGKKAFIERQDLACFRCHKINGEGGEVGPELAGIGQKHPREYILESILFPNKNVAPGFESVIVTLKDGTSYAGLLKSENEAQLVINSPEDGPVTVKKADVQTRDRGLSAMPEEIGNVLSKTDLRNLLEFLATLK